MYNLQINNEVNARRSNYKKKNKMCVHKVEKKRPKLVYIISNGIFVRAKYRNFSRTFNNFSLI